MPVGQIKAGTGLANISQQHSREEGKSEASFVLLAHWVSKQACSPAMHKSHCTGLETKEGQRMGIDTTTNGNESLPAEHFPAPPATDGPQTPLCSQSTP